MNGILLALGASLAFSLMNALAKGCDLPPAEIAFVRGLVGLIVTVLVMRRGGASFKGARPRVLFVRGVLGAVSLILNFTALSGLPLADATFLSHASSVFVVIFGHFCLGERLPSSFYSLFGIALSGVLLVLQPGGDLLHGRYALAGLASAVTAAGAALSIRNLSRDHGTHLIMLYFMAAATLIPLPLLVGRFQVPGLLDATRLVMLSVVSYGGQYLLTRAYAFRESAIVAMARFSGVGFNIALGFVFWRELPSALSVVGGTLIMTACLLLYRSELRAGGAAHLPEESRGRGRREGPDGSPFRTCAEERIDRSAPG